MNKKITISICIILMAVVLVIIGVMFGDNAKDNVTNLPSGEESKPIGSVMDYVDSSKATFFEGFIKKENLNVYAPVQEIRLEEIKIREYTWSMQGINLSNIEIDSGETKLLYSEYGVGDVEERIYKIKGIKEGETLLRFDASYRQKRGEPLVYSQTVIYKISVNADNQVAIVEEVRFEEKEKAIERDNNE